jgi:hypothetical protein
LYSLTNIFVVFHTNLLLQIPLFSYFSLVHLNLLLILLFLSLFLSLFFYISSSFSFSISYSLIPYFSFSSLLSLPLFYPLSHLSSPSLFLSFPRLSFLPVFLFFLLSMRFLLGLCLLILFSLIFSNESSSPFLFSTYLLPFFFSTLPFTLSFSLHLLPQLLLYPLSYSFIFPLLFLNLLLLPLPHCFLLSPSILPPPYPSPPLSLYPFTPSPPPRGGGGGGREREKRLTSPNQRTWQPTGSSEAKKYKK